MPAITQTITVRITPELYQQLRQNADDADVSLNEYIVESLADHLEWLKSPQRLQQLKERQ